MSETKKLTKLEILEARLQKTKDALAKAKSKEADAERRARTHYLVELGARFESACIKNPGDKSLTSLLEVFKRQIDAQEKAREKMKAEKTKEKSKKVEVQQSEQKPESEQKPAEV